LDLFCVLLSASVVGLVWWDRYDFATVLLLDRTRPQQESGDFVSLFLDTTQTDYSLEEGFVSLDASPVVRRRMLQLLAGLQLCIAVNEENRRRLTSNQQGPVLTCVPNEEGKVQVVPSGTTSDSLQRLEQEKESLLQQRQMVADAIRQLHSKPVAFSNPFKWQGNTQNVDPSQVEYEVLPTSASSEPDSVTPPAAPSKSTETASTSATVEKPASKTVPKVPKPPDDQRVELTEIESLAPK
jgi:hypothetical protein